MKKTPLKKVSDSHTNEWHRKKAVETAKLVAKHIGGYICCNPECLKSAEQGYQMHGSHILPEGKFHRMSVVVENIKCMCARCHMNWHENPLAQHKWFDKVFPGEFENLNEMEYELKQGFIKPDYKKINEELKEQYKSMIN